MINKKLIFALTISLFNISSFAMEKPSKKPRHAVTPQSEGELASHELDAGKSTNVNSIPTLFNLCTNYIEDSVLDENISINFDFAKFQLPEEIENHIKSTLFKNLKIWPMLKDSIIFRELNLLSTITTIAISSDNKYIFTGNYDGQIGIYDVTTGKSLCICDAHKGSEINSITISNNGDQAFTSQACDKFIVTTAYDGTVKIWDIEGLINESANSCLHTLVHTSNVDEFLIIPVSISNNNKFLVTGTYDNKAKIWDIKSGKCLYTLGGHTGPVRAIAISNDNKYIVTGSEDHSAKIWDAKSGECLRTLGNQEDGHTRGIYSIAITNDNKFIITGDDAGEVKIWNFEIGEYEARPCLRTLKGHTNLIYYLAISNDNQFVISGSFDNTVRIWDLNTDKCLHVLGSRQEAHCENGHTAQIFSVVLSNDNKFIITGAGDKSTKIWDVKSGKCLLTLMGHVDKIYSAKISNDNKFIVTNASYSTGSTVRIWQINYRGSLQKLIQEIRKKKNKSTSQALSMNSML